jgi:AcrR family transcriptional regulator
MVEGVRDRRSRILQVAEEEFARQGYNGVGMREIAARAGIHSATLYHYFSGKEELFFSVIERVFHDAHQWIQETLSRPLGGREKLVFFIEKQFDFLATHQNYFRIILHERLSNSPRLQEIARRFIAPLVQTLSSLLEELARSGVLRPVDQRIALFQLMTVNAAHIVFAPLLTVVLGEEEGLTFGLLQRLKKANVDLFLHGIAG